MSSILGPGEADALLARIDGAAFQEFRFGSKLLAEAARLNADDGTEEKDRVTRALVMRHHYLQNKSAESCIVLRHTIKEIQRPNFITLRNMLLSSATEEVDAASFVLGELGGVIAFQMILNLLRRKRPETYPKLLPCLAHVIQRYYEVMGEAEPTAEVMDVATGETKQVSLKKSFPDIYERAMMSRASMNEFFLLTSEERLDEMVALIDEIPERSFGTTPKDQLSAAIALLRRAGTGQSGCDAHGH